MTNELTIAEIMKVPSSTAWKVDQINMKLAAKDAEIAALKSQLAEPAEPARHAPGEWIEWKGWEYPVPLDKRCRVRFRDGDEFVIDVDTDLSWEHYGGSGDIVAYQVMA